jgi:hypothetical protein
MSGEIVMMIHFLSASFNVILFESAAKRISQGRSMCRVTAIDYKSLADGE